MVMKYALYLTYTLSWISFDYSARSLKQQYADSHVAPLGHINLIPSQTVFTSVLVLKYHHCVHVCESQLVTSMILKYNRL
jgi:hypothetical protein